MSTIIELREVWKIYKLGDVDVSALRGLNLKVDRGEFLAIMGKSGSGKSTAMNMIGCLDLPSKGHIFLDNHDISRLSESDLAQIRGRKIGFIFQTFNLLPSLDAIENVMLPMTFQGYEVEERYRRAKKALEEVELGHRLFHKPNELSGGERQRVAIARALVNDPEVILADEPTGNLDSKTGKEVMMILSKLYKEKKRTVIMVTHDANLCDYASRVFYLKDGVGVSQQEYRKEVKK